MNDAGVSPGVDTGYLSLDSELSFYPVDAVLAVESGCIVHCLRAFDVDVRSR